MLMVFLLEELAAKAKRRKATENNLTKLGLYPMFQKKMICRLLLALCR
jgi:hypothetical protein